MATKTQTRYQARIPSLRRCNGRGFVELNKRRIYLGPWGDSKTKQNYERTIAEWLENGRRVRAQPNEVTIVEVAAAYYEHAKSYYVAPTGANTTTLEGAREAVRILKRLYGPVPAIEFGPLALRSIRQVWVDRGLSRTTVNYYTRHAKRMFKWAASHEMIPAETYHALNTVEGLRRGRSQARDGSPVRPVPERHISAILPYLSRQVAGLVRLQLLTGTRSAEILRLRPIDLDTSGPVWTAQPEVHKTSYRGKKRTIYFGPKAQEILRGFLKDRPIDAYLFNPREAEAERRAMAPTHRRPDQKQAPRKTNRVVGDYYTPASYRRAITRACERACVPHWTPHRLRHTAATRIRKEFGLEAAQVILGHSRADTTEIYAELDQKQGALIAAQIG